MEYERLGIVLLLLLTAVVVLGIGLYTYFSARGKQGVSVYVWLTIASGIYTIGYALELSSDTLQDILFWLKIEYIGIPAIPALCLFMSMDYVGMEGSKNKRWLAYAFAVPLVTYVLYYTNDYHHLFYQSVSLQPDTPFPIANIKKGFWYWVHISYSYLSVLGSVFLLMKNLYKTSLKYRMQILSMSFGLLVPLLGNQIYITGNSPWGIDLSPLMMCLAAPFHAWSLLSFRLFNLIPVAREKVFETMQDGVLVLDSADRLVDFNPAAAAIFPTLTSSAVGEAIQHLLAAHADVVHKLWMNNTGFDCLIRRGDQKEYYRMGVSAITNTAGQTIGRIIEISNITDSVVLHEHLHKLATIDGLTQVLNRTHFMEECESVIEKVKQCHAPISFIMLDIDYFKKINDSYGHLSGDAVIQKIASVCQENIGAPGIVGRYGGEEFMICLPYTPVSQCIELGERLRELIAQQSVPVIGGNIHVTASFGVSGRYHLSNDVNVDQLLKEADDALYLAKNQGRNRVAVYKEEEKLVALIATNSRG
ncbi:histidine kinase N-terminal 7TM domain-containing diguanylate cyclase [Brevibacillus sp. SYSU BS000544]|uniref:histidine kinase N-terminal 7TM domain-containing diguanylate cyclase n=1 Tax=Brevibacillus sp. SYSU BS000544 TaxID=3416443 RepID=UPI003CE4AB7A